MTTTLLDPEVLLSVSSQLDRCDACGAAGKVHVVLYSGRDLVFCGHHFHDASQSAGTLGTFKRVDSLH